MSVNFSRGSGRREGVAPRETDPEPPPAAPVGFSAPLHEANRPPEPGRRRGRPRRAGGGDSLLEISLEGSKAQLPALPRGSRASSLLSRRLPDERLQEPKTAPEPSPRWLTHVVATTRNPPWSSPPALPHHGLVSPHPEHSGPKRSQGVPPSPASLARQKRDEQSPKHPPFPSYSCPSTQVSSARIGEQAGFMELRDFIFTAGRPYVSSSVVY